MNKKEPETQALAVVPPGQLDPKYERAFMLYTEIVHRRAEIAKNFLELGRLFKTIRDEKLYKALDHDTFTSLLGDLGFRETTVYGYIHAYELYVMRLGIPPDFLVQIPYRNLLRINAVVEKNPEEWLYKAKELSGSDLITEVRLAQGKPVEENFSKTPEIEPEKPKPFDFKDYQEFVKAYGCILCSEKNVEGAHFPQTQKRGAPDHWIIPLCSGCHKLYHSDPIDFLITYRNQIFGFFYTVFLACYELLKGGKE